MFRITENLGWFVCNRLFDHSYAGHVPSPRGSTRGTPPSEIVFTSYICNILHKSSSPILNTLTDKSILSSEVFPSFHLPTISFSLFLYFSWYSFKEPVKNTFTSCVRHTYMYCSIRAVACSSTTDDVKQRSEAKRKPSFEK